MVVQCTNCSANTFIHYTVLYLPTELLFAVLNVGLTHRIGHANVWKLLTPKSCGDHDIFVKNVSLVCHWRNLFFCVGLSSVMSGFFLCPCGYLSKTNEPIPSPGTGTQRDLLKM